MVAMEFCGHCCILRHTTSYLCDGVYFSCCTDCGKVLSESCADCGNVTRESIPVNLRTNKSDRIMKKKRKNIAVKKT
ncbi:unnamed protein product [Lathyrus oleraceus]